ncbi:MAG: hypothetical protein QNI95_02095 [Desulfobacterales bacterium]|nr:hypothetical protein [Desulfobacterales bacterium]
MKIAFHDRDRRGIFIHQKQLTDSSFKPGDRFALKKGQFDLFTLTIIKDTEGDILFDKNGIFIERSRRVDMLLGGIFDEYVVEVEPHAPNTLQLRPLEIVEEERATGQK